MLHYMLNRHHRRSLLWISSTAAPVMPVRGRLVCAFAMARGASIRTPARPAEIPIMRFSPDRRSSTIPLAAGRYSRSHDILLLQTRWHVLHDGGGVPSLPTKIVPANFTIQRMRHRRSVLICCAAICLLRPRSPLHQVIPRGRGGAAATKWRRFGS